MPLVTLILVALNLAGFTFELVDGPVVCETYGLIPRAFVHGGSLEPLLTSLFLHDPSTWFHLGGNMAFLAVFGWVVENELGSTRFLGLYVVAGISGALTHVVVAPGAVDPLVGCSACIFGLMPVAAVARPRACLAFVVVLVGVNLYQLLTATGGTVSVAAHVGGFSIGVLVAALVRSSLVEEERFA